MRTAVISDLHLGSAGGADLLRRDDIRAALWKGLEGADRIVLLGDVLELRDRPLLEVMDLARPFFDELASRSEAASILIVPGNHDHHLLAGWLERRQLAGAGPMGLEERMPVSDSPLVALLGPASGRTEIAYPGVWLRPDTYATHGHYLDRHLTIPTFERLAVAAVERVIGASREVAEEPGASGEPDSAIPDDYERVQAPVYAFLFALAQAGGGRMGGANPSARVWQALGGGFGRAARVRGWLLGTVALPGAVRVANRLGLGPVRSDLSPGAVTKAGLAAIGEVAYRLGIEADHLLFGHTHRRGPMGGESGWRMPTGTRLWNTGSWVYSPGLLGATAEESPYWPGTMVILDDAEPPEPRHLLDGLDKAALRGSQGD
jgi:hypothetical protein